MLAKIQHYVPQFLLKQFASRRKKEKAYIWAYDKKTGKIFNPNVKGVAAERGFYNFEFKKNKLTIEPSLSNIETHVSKIIKNIVQKDSISDLSNADMLSLSYFFALQFVRTKKHRQLFKEVYKTLDLETNNNALKFHGIQSVINLSEYAPYFLNKSWVLFKTTKSHPLYISDNPVTLQNMIDHGPYGNIGLAIRGIKIYFPLSKTLALGMFCPSHEEEFRKTYEKYKLIMRLDPEPGSRSIKDSFFISQIMNGFEKKETVSLDPKMVLNINSLQVIFSSRFIFSSDNNFSLASNMIQDNPKLRYE
jgi:hypothetical protein